MKLKRLSEFVTDKGVFVNPDRVIASNVLFLQPGFRDLAEEFISEFDYIIYYRFFVVGRCFYVAYDRSPLQLGYQDHHIVTNRCTHITKEFMNIIKLCLD